MDAGEKTDLDTFITYIRKSYGGTPEQLRLAFTTTRQAQDESCITFFRRVVSTYFRSRNQTTVPALSAISNTAEQDDIRFQYLSGLRNQHTANMLRTAQTTVPFIELGKRAQQLENSIVKTNANDTPLSINVSELADQIYSMNFGHVQRSRGRGGYQNNRNNINRGGFQQYRGRTQNRSYRNGPSSFRGRYRGRYGGPGANRSNRGDKKCWSCGFTGHVRAECRAPPKTRARFNRNQTPYRKSSENRERSRSADRGRVKGRRESNERRSRERSFSSFRSHSPN